MPLRMRCSSIAPNTGSVGATVTIDGSGFGSAQRTSTLQFYGAPAAVTSWSDTQIVATVSPGAATGPVIITVAGVVSLPSAFTVNTAVQVTDSLGHITSYASTMIGGAWRASDSQGSGCSSCTVRGTIHNDFDTLGNVLVRTDELGQTTNYEYDPANN